MNGEREAFLKDAKEKSLTKPVQLSVRQLLAQWNAKRRGYWIADQIERDLEAAGLATDPPFKDVWIDTRIKLIPIVRYQSRSSPAEAPAPAAPIEVEKPDVYLRVGNLKSANSGVTSVGPQDSIQKAQSLMLGHDYSQLAVMSGERDLRGAVSWESIAQARIRTAEVRLADAMSPPETVREEDDLLAQIPRIVSSGFVFVQAKDKCIVGIVTTADLSEEFARTANPFFIIGEIERRLRTIIDASFSPEELAAVVDPSDTTRQVSNADDLTFGEYIRLLEFPERWDKLAWDLDRKTFVTALTGVKDLRNDVMHFSPDPLDDEAVTTLRVFAQWLRKVGP